MGRIFPAEWDELVAPIPPDERDGDLAAAYARLLASPNSPTREDAAARWCSWEDTHVSLAPGARAERYDDPTFRSVFARLVTHYWANGCFLRDDEVLEGMATLATTPGILVHGRRDISTPSETAFRLHERWPASQLVVVDGAGHGGRRFETALVQAIGELGTRVARGGAGREPPGGA